MASSEVVITYETLFELYRREKNRDELQKLEQDFFERALTYLKGLKKTTVEMTDDAIERNRSIALNIKKLLRDIYGRRERKIITMAIIKTVTPQSIIDTAALMEHEKMLFDSLCDLLKLKRLQVLSQLENNESAFNLISRISESVAAPSASAFASLPSSSTSVPPGVPSVSSSSSSSSSAIPSRPSDAEIAESDPPIRLQFREDQPKFIGPNLEIYGPYTSGDTAELPKIIADIILETGKAVTV